MNAICRYRLYKALGLPQKIPGHFSKTYHNVVCTDRNDNTVIKATVIVRTTTKAKGFNFKHRVMIKCELCGKEIPFGRWHQHYPACCGKSATRLGKQLTNNLFTNE